MTKLRDLLRPVRTRATCMTWQSLTALGLHPNAAPPVAFVIERADWAIRWVGEKICAEVERIEPGTAAVASHPARLIDRVVHFGSQYMWIAWGAAMAKSNRNAVSFFHGKPQDGPEVRRHIEAFLDTVPRLSRVVTASSIMEARLLSWGVPREKVVRIPIGVDTELFAPPSAEQRDAARKRLGIAPKQIAIGSFQKDGVGWGDGMEPKLIKGPDILVETAALLRRELSICVVLTGPARGYVKQGLERLGIPYVHAYVESHEQLVPYYHALDLYLVTSREEGGPMGLMESMASGVPVASTRVGMAPDLLAPDLNGMIAESEDFEGLSAASLALLAPSGDRAEHAAAARKRVVETCDWRVVGATHLEEVYRPLL